MLVVFRTAVHSQISHPFDLAAIRHLQNEVQPRDAAWGRGSAPPDLAPILVSYDGLTVSRAAANRSRPKARSQ